jgi:hypothetical protein
MIASIVMLLIIGSVIAFSIKLPESKYLAPVPVVTPSPLVTKLPYGKVSLSIGQTATFDNLTLKLLRVTEDSRCPQDVQCIWAGTFKVEVESVSGMGQVRVSSNLESH